MKIIPVFKQSKNSTIVQFNTAITESRFIITHESTILEIPVQKEKDLTRRNFIKLMRRVVLVAKKYEIEKITINSAHLPYKHLMLTLTELGEICAWHWAMANYNYNRHKEKPKNGFHTLKEIQIISEEENHAELKRGLKKGQIIAHYINVCRELANMSGGDMTPAVLAAETRKLTKNTKIKVTAFHEKEIKKMKMGGIIAVSQGSSEEARLIVVEYYGGKENEKPVVLVGKGVTFDTGGINIKPETAIFDMNMDMSGGAAVICTTILAEKLGIKKNIIAIVPAVENMPSGTSYRPGDVIKSLSGKTIEVRNTDAEGRIILADALTYAKKFNPQTVIDVATLTGASLVALGERASAVLTKNDSLSHTLQKSGETAFDFVWPLPLWDEFEDDIKGEIGDLANLGKSGGGRYGGAITAGSFLYQFAKDFPEWAHIDIAPRMHAVPDENLERGAIGAGVGLLIKYLEQ